MNSVSLRKFVVNDTENAISFTLYIESQKQLDGQHPLVLFSHGNGGTPLIYRTITTFLAKNGYVVAMPEHYGNNRLNNDLAESVLNLQFRPLHIALTIDYVLNSPIFSAHINADKIAVVGHSFGGYTALAVAGGIPWSREGQRLDVKHDTRVKALVLLVPAAPYFLAPDALKQVRIPILLYSAQKDGVLPNEWSSDVVLHGVPDLSMITHREVENAGHFSFISPFPEGFRSPEFLPSTDPDGFDRKAYHHVLPLEILRFLHAVLF